MKKLISWLRTPFKKKESDLESGEKIKGFPQPVSGFTGYETQPITGIEWIDNDGLLRDEGVLFGIAETDFSEKVDSIKSGFDKVKGAFVITQKHIEDSLIGIEKEEEKGLDAIVEIKKQLTALRANNVVGTHSVLPGLFQLIAYTAICFFNYYLMLYWLKPVFAEQTLIPIGLYLFGLLSVFMGRAMVYNSSSLVQSEGDEGRPVREKWKILLEELGIPIVVSGFISILSFKFYPVEWSVAAFLLFFFLFSFSGKGLVNIIHTNYRYLKLQIKHRKSIRDKKKEIKGEEFTLIALEKRKETLEKELQIPATKLSELNALLSYKIKIFESEYNLAKEARSQLSGKQVASF
jgi:hypothetical protein